MIHPVRQCLGQRCISSQVSSHISTCFVLLCPPSNHLFADCVSVKGADPPYIKDTYPAEAMAEVVVANLYKSKTIQCMASCPGVLRELGGLQVMTLCSLGPSDGLFCINDRMVSWGRPATIVKGTIEVTKMSDSRNEFLGRNFRSLVPHW